MNTLQLGVIKLIDSALNGVSNTLPDGFDLKETVKLAQSHNIVPLIYYGAMNCKIDETSSLMKEMFSITCQNVYVSTQQLYQLEELFKCFNKEKIDYMPLKGCLLKKLYPNPEMRVMGDADILIKTEQYEKIKDIMFSLGFDEKYESDHELVWRKKQFMVELHKRLIPSYSKDYYSYFGDGWALAKIHDGTRYSMTDEDQFIYLFTHFAKHYRSSGIGIKHIIDLWVYIKSKSNLNKDYIEAELKKLKLYDFYANVMDTLLVWFNGKDEDEKARYITEVIFNNGTFGLRESGILWSAIKGAHVGESTVKIRIKKIINTVFLPYKNMCEKFPVLIKCPILLPWFWLLRIVKLVFKKHRLKEYTNELEVLSKGKIENYYDSLTYVGLDFDFKE